MTPSPTLEYLSALRFPAQALVHDLRWSPDGSQFAVSAGTNIHVYETANFDEQYTLSFGLWAGRIAFHPSEPILAAASKDGRIRFWNSAHGHEMCTFLAHRKGANGLAFQPEPSGAAPGRNTGLLATTGAEIISRLWNISTVVEGGCNVSERANLIGNSYTAPAIAFSTDGEQLAVVDIRNIFLHEARTRKLITILESERSVFDIALSADGHWLAAAHENATVALWDLTTQPDPTATILHIPATRPKTYAWRVAFSSDSSLLAGGTSEGALLVWELPGLEPVFRRSLPQAISALDFKPQTHLLATGSLDGSVHIYAPDQTTP